MDKLINDFKISFTKGDTYALAIKFKNLSEDLRTAFFTVKENPDDEPLLQKSLGAGIDKIDDRTYKNEKTYKLQIQAGDTANLEAHVQYLYDLQVAVGNVVKTVISGVFVVTHSLSGNASAFGSTLEVAIDDTLETEVYTTPATNGIEYETDPVANAKIGDMSGLTTENKETLVKAINEVKNGTKTNADDIYKIKNGTIPVPKSQHAEKAKDYDESGGISSKFNEIENRLTELGFKQGVAEYKGFYTEPTANSLKKQGKYVIFNFLSGNDNVISANSIATITIPEEFRPNEDTHIVVSVVAVGAIAIQGGLLATVSAETGEISITAGQGETFLNVSICNCGWETK